MVSVEAPEGFGRIRGTNSVMLGYCHHLRPVGNGGADLCPV